jgi:restriction system protein
LLAVEWILPTFDIVPVHKEFRHVKTRKAVEPVARPLADAQRLYKAVFAQVAVRMVREVFTVCPEDYGQHGRLQRPRRHRRPSDRP